MKKREPPNLPDRGDRCALRGNKNSIGTLLKFDPESEWATVDWDSEGPKVCHRYELVKV